MPIYKYSLNTPTSKTIQRIQEIQFYLFLESFFYKYNTDNQYIIALIETYATLFDCKATHISIIIDHFKSPAYRPDKEEIVIASFLLGIPIRQIQEITKIGIATYYRKLTGYIKKGQPELNPRLNDIYTNELQKFLSNAKIMFNNVSNSLKGTELYDQYPIQR